MATCRRVSHEILQKSIYSPRHWQLAEMLRRRRTDVGLTQQEVAGRLGRHHPFVHDYETGQRRLDVVRLQEVVHALDTTLVAVVEELFGTENPSATYVEPVADFVPYEADTAYLDEWTRLCTLLRSLRQAAGLTGVEVAARLGEPQSFVSKYETKKRRLDLIELEQIALALDTTLVSLVAEFERGRGTVE